MGANILQAENICKSYSGVEVLRGVSIDVPEKSILGLIGENGAGKSTFIKCVNGLTKLDSGRVVFEGRELKRTTVSSALKHGIITIPQEFNLAPDMTVTENIFLGHELHNSFGFIASSEMKRRTKEILNDLECSVEPDAEVSTLSIAEKQMVEIARALNHKCRLLIMDEPSTVLNPPEVENLFRIMRKLRDSGTSIIYVSHKLYEVKEICDEIAVLRDGELVARKPTAEVTPSGMANLMVGRELSRIFPPKVKVSETSPVILETEKLTLRKLVKDVSFKLRKGEILGFAGLGGSGRTELAEAIYGVRKTVSGTIRKNGKILNVNSPAEAVAAGIAYLSEDRQGSGVITSFSVTSNNTLISLKNYCSGGFIRKSSEREAAKSYAEKFALKTPSLDSPLNFLSGGNQQKVAIAKGLDTKPEVFIFDEPTRGIDIKSRSEVYHFIHGLAAQGVACIIISSDLEEIIGLCARVAVMRGGTIAGFLEDDHVNEKEIMYLAAGVK